MKPKTAMTAVLLLFVVVSVTFLIAQEVRRDRTLQAALEEARPTAEPTSGTVTAEPVRKVIAYYFHGTVRCESCMKIESYAEEAIVARFAEAIKAGLLEWRPVNVDEPEHEHFVKDYDLYSKQIVLVTVENGQQKQWKDLDKIWTLLDKKIAFQAYIKSELSRLLGES